MSNSHTPKRKPQRPSSHAQGRKTNPARRQPAAVYRRRRLTVLGLSVVVVALLVLGVVLLVQAFAQRPKVDAQQAPAGQEQAAQPTEEAAPGPGEGEASGECPPQAMKVEAKTDKDTYTVKSSIKLELLVTSEHDSSCQFAVGPDVQSFTIKQNKDTVWSSDYCRAGEQEPSVQVFAPGAQKRSVLPWDMIPTDKNCNRTADTLEAGQYQFTVKLGDLESQPVSFTVTDPEAEASASAAAEASASAQPQDQAKQDN